MVNITDFTVVLLEDPRHDTFQLTDDTRGKTESLKALMLFYWFVTSICRALYCEEGEGRGGGG